MKLENITGKITHPCVFDVKIGARSYDPYATPEKIKSESSKCPHQSIMGFRLSGMRVRTYFVMQTNSRCKVFHRLLYLSE